jgi:hypothetical protein
MMITVAFSEWNGICPLGISFLLDGVSDKLGMDMGMRSMMYRITTSDFKLGYVCHH